MDYTQALYGFLKNRIQKFILIEGTTLSWFKEP